MTDEVLGKIPPQNIEAEEAVLSVLLIESSTMDEVVTIIPNPDVFYKNEHQEIYRACLDLYNNSSGIDLLTVTEQLRKNAQLDMVGGPYYVTNLTTKANSGAHIEYHCRILLEKYFSRLLIEASSKTLQDAYSEKDPFEVLDEQYNVFNKITDSLGGKRKRTMKQIVRENLDHIEETKNIPDHVTGIHTGFHVIDQDTAGWQNGDLIILAARPGMGKTGLALNFVKAAAIEHKKKVAMFSLEMRDTQLVLRMMSAASEIEMNKLVRASVSDEEIGHLMNKVDPLLVDNLHIYDEAGMSVMKLKAMCNQLKKKSGLDMIVVDYLQLMSGDPKSKNREQEISYISRNLKGLAKELNVPVIALSQLSRAVEARSKPEPKLSDLRESGSIEQDADIVLFLYRPEYYNISEDEDGNPTDGRAQIITAKHRQGALGHTWIKFVGKFITFKDRDSSTMHVPEYSQKLHESYAKKSVEKEDEDDLPF